MGSQLGSLEEEPTSDSANDQPSKDRNPHLVSAQIDITNVISHFPNSPIEMRFKKALKLDVVNWQLQNRLTQSNKVQQVPIAEVRRPQQNEECEELIVQVLQRLDEKTAQQIQDKTCKPANPLVLPHRYESAMDQIYTGQYSGTNRHGYGIQLWSDGAYYEGHWDNDTPSGYGVLISPQGAIYFGKWSHGRQYDDDGEAWCPRGSHYRGSFRNGFKDGMGILKLKSGDRYEGKFLADLFHGKGRYVWHTKKIYEGNWEKNYMHGEGIMCWADQTMYKGRFEYDQRHGYGEMISQDGRIYQGHWKDGKKHGTATFNEYAGGPLISARFEAGVRQPPI